MKITEIAGVLVLTSCLWARSQGADSVQLLISAEDTTNMRDGTRGIEAYLIPVGPMESRVRAGRVAVSQAMDDAGAVLTQSTTDKFYSVSVGRTDGSRDLTSREATPFSLWGLSKGSKAIESLSGVLELVIPDLDPDSSVVVENLTSAYGLAIASGALAKAGVTLTVFDRKSAHASAGAKTPGGPQDYDSGILFGNSYRLPAGFPKPEMEEGDIAVAIDDPQERLVGLEIQAKDGSPLRYNHGGNYHSSGLKGSPGRRFDIYRLGTVPPADARLACWLITPKALLKIPFHIDKLPLPGAGEGRRDLGIVTVRLEAAANGTRDTLKYEEESRDAKLAAVAPQGMEKIILLWSDVPEYLAILKRDMHYKKLPRLVSSVPPELPPGPLLPPLATVNVLVSFVVGDRGIVEAARVAESDDARFNPSAVEAVLRWRFRPAETESGPAIAFVTIPFVFNAPKTDQAAPPR